MTRLSKDEYKPGGIAIKRKIPVLDKESCVYCNEIDKRIELYGIVAEIGKENFVETVVGFLRKIRLLSHGLERLLVVLNDH